MVKSTKLQFNQKLVQLSGYGNGFLSEFKRPNNSKHGKIMLVVSTWATLQGTATLNCCVCSNKPSERGTAHKTKLLSTDILPHAFLLRSTFPWSSKNCSVFDFRAIVYGAVCEKSKSINFFSLFPFFPHSKQHLLWIVTQIRVLRFFCRNHSPYEIDQQFFAPPIALQFGCDKIYFCDTHRHWETICVEEMKGAATSGNGVIFSREEYAVAVFIIYCVEKPPHQSDRNASIRKQIAPIYDLTKQLQFDFSRQHELVLLSELNCRTYQEYCCAQTFKSSR